MNSLALKFNRFDFSQRVVVGLLIFYVVSASLVYIYGLNRLILNVVLKEKMEKQISSLSVEISELESKYMNLKNGLDQNMATDTGMLEDFDRIYFADISNASTLGLSKK